MTTMRSYAIVLEPQETGRLIVRVPALPGCVTQGSTVEECRQRATEAISTHIAGLEADGERVPEELCQPNGLTVTVGA